MKRTWALAAIVAAFLAPPLMAAIERFPPPDFTNHQLPQTTTPAADSIAWEYLDVAVLAAALALATYLALVRRSRRALVLLTMASLAWFGFWRQGCICPIGAIQNVTLAVADPGYSVPFSVIALFGLPILTALFFGRTFCAAVCPLGAVQELVALKPLRVPNWIDQSLGLLPYVYLGAAVLFSATGSVFLICAYDPFVGLFRLSASTSMLILGACFLVIGLFVGRPYCRYLCPYGAILGLCSKVSKRHVRIPPEECIQCRLCEDACPYGAILEPSVAQKPADRRRARTRLAALLALSPVLVAAGYLLGSGLGLPFSKLHPTVRLAEYVAQAEPAPDPTGLDVESPRLKQRNDALEAFRNTGRPARDLLAEALALRQRFQVGGAWLGAWVGLVVAVKLLHLSIRRRRTDYQPDKANCVSCGRCFWYCPHEQLRLGLIETLPTVALPVAAAQRDGDSSAPRTQEVVAR